MQKTSGNQNCSATINVSNVNDVVVTIPTASRLLSLFIMVEAIFGWLKLLRGVMFFRFLVD